MSTARSVRNVLQAIKDVRHTLAWAIFDAAVIIGCAVLLLLFVTTLIRILGRLRGDESERNEGGVPAGFDRLLKPRH